MKEILLPLCDKTIDLSKLDDQLIVDYIRISILGYNPLYLECQGHESNKKE